jgi:hypothetical protein
MSDVTSEINRLSEYRTDEMARRLLDAKRAENAQLHLNEGDREGKGGKASQQSPSSPTPSEPNKDEADSTLIGQSDRLRLEKQHPTLENPFFGLLSNRLHLGWPEPDETTE